MDKNNDTNVNRWVDDHLANLNPSREWQPDVARAFNRFEKQRAPEPVRSRKLTWATAVVAGGACLMAFPAPRGIAHRCVGACENFFLNGATAARPAEVARATENEAAPDFTLKDMSGAKVRLADYKGKVVLLNFWATWCAPCTFEIPWFAEFERTFKDRGFSVIGISMDDDGWKSVKPYIEAKKVDYRIAAGDADVAQKYGGVEALPETFLIDREGRIAFRHVGIVSKADYEKEIAGLLAR